MEDMMATAADKKRWDSLHADLTKKSEALLAYEIELGRKYGHNFAPSWLSSGQRNKLEKLRDAKNRAGDKIYELVTRIGPRDWSSGVPAWWVQSELTWEDATRPANEPLSVVVPGAYGYQDGYVKEPRRKTMTEHDDEYDDEDDEEDEDEGNGADDIEYAVDDASGQQRTFKTFDEAAGFAVGIAISGRENVYLDVIVWSRGGARAYGGDDAVEWYDEDPEASVFERFKINVNAMGRVA